MGEQHIYGYQADARCKVMVLCDIDEEKLRSVGVRHPDIALTTSADEILEDPKIGIVSIASYDDSHASYVIRALKAGKHVFVEKPLCLNQNEQLDIARVLVANPTAVLSSNLILRMYPRFKRLKQAVGDNRLGNIYYLEGDYDYGRLHKLIGGWRGSVRGYSVVHGGAIHLIDVILWLVGRPVTQVFALGNKFCSANSRFIDNDLVVALLKFDNGVIAKVSANFGSATPHFHKLAVYGTDGSFHQAHSGTEFFMSREPHLTRDQVTDPYPGAFKSDLIPSFLSSILDGKPALVSAQEVLDTMSVSLAIERSTAAGTPVDVRYHSVGRNP